jgi:hypothetical protein
VRVVISFSVRFKMVLNRGWGGPRAVSISRRLFKSAVLNVLVRVAAVRYVAVNAAAPMIGWIRLLEGRVELAETVRLGFLRCFVI